MKKKQIRNSFLLVLAAFIWGIAFVAQTEGGNAIGPYSFNGLRSILGSACLVPVILCMDKFRPSPKRPVTKEQKKRTWIAGISCGIVLCLATNLQQVGLYLGTSAGKAGFLTACYILIVPILGIFLKRKCGINIWIAVVMALFGLYLLCMQGSMTVQFSDLLVLCCALCFSVQIMLVDHFIPTVDGVRLSCIQFLTCGVIGTIIMLFTEMKPFQGGLSSWLVPFGLSTVWIAILYAGIMSSGVAYTLQILGQDEVNPTIASLLMSLESVFALLAGAVILGERMSTKEIVGCLLMFAAIILAQIPVGRKHKDA